MDNIQVKKNKQFKITTPFGVFHRSKREEIRRACGFYGKIILGKPFNNGCLVEKVLHRYTLVDGEFEYLFNQYEEMVEYIKNNYNIDVTIFHLKYITEDVLDQIQK